MERAQLIAAIVAVVVIGALVAVRIGADTDAAAQAGAAGGAPTDRDAETGSTSGTEPQVGDSDTGGDDGRRDAADDGADDEEEEEDKEEEVGEAPENLGPAGTLRELDGWLQTEATSFEDFDGQVRIVQFWTFGCYNCRNTIPALQGIYERWQPEGLEIIGVHSPEFEREKEVDAIAAAAVDHGVTWPIALDTEKTNFRDWQPGRRFWPRTFVIDQNGDVRFNHIGEGRYEELEETVAYLVENGP